MKHIHDAIQDCKIDALAGREINFAEIADDYDLNPKLLERKWNESFPNGYKTIESALAPRRKVTPSAYRIPADRLQTKVESVCARYKVSPAGCTVETIRGVPYTIIGKFRTRLLGVSHIDGCAYKISGVR